MNRSPQRGDIAPRLQRRFPKRPPRLELLFSSMRSFYFVTFNTRERLSLLERDEVHDVFHSFCVRAEKHNIAVGRYVLMPDHVHLFVAFPMTGLTLSKWDWRVENRSRKGIAQTGNSEAALAERFLRSCLAECRKLLAEVGIRADESGRSGTLRKPGAMALSTRDRKHPVRLTFGTVT